MDDTDVQNVTFKLSTLHGDADLYVSRRHKYPNKIENEKSSTKSLQVLDMVYFDGPGLAGTYYIAVYSL